MPEWTTEIRSKFKAPMDDEVIAELSNYLEDLYESEIARGSSEAEATSRCKDEASQIARVAREIRSAKRGEKDMKERVRSLWLPSLVAFATASVLLMIFQHTGFAPHVFWRKGVAIAVYVPWLLTLPLCGAAGAYLSRRAGGKAAVSVTAGLFPAIVMLALFALILPIGIVMERIHNPGWTLNVNAVLITTCNWAVVPALALLIGAAPVTYFKSKEA